ncbi:hypothetical protein DFS33DRAFT_1267203, partial [Desarmillaria ectypa]
HNAYKCGKYWENIPNYEHRGTCTTCNAEDFLRHILPECNVPGQEIIWGLAQKLWEKKHLTRPSITYDKIPGCSNADFKDEKGNTLRGPSRL